MEYIISSLRCLLGRQFFDALPFLNVFRLPFSLPIRLQAKSRLEGPSFSDLVAASDYDDSLLLSSEEADLKSIADSSVQTRANLRPALLELPADILYLVSDQLDTASVHALALTCRDLYCIGFPKTQRKLRTEEKKTLLTTLERDRFGQGHFYCHKCNKLHNYEPTCGPQDEEEVEGSLLDCGLRDVFAPTGNPFGLGYHHARLVMNRHFFGADHGIPLDNICVTNEAHRGRTTITCTTKARVIHDELFLHRAYTFRVPDDAAAAAEFRRCTGHRDFRLCEHVSFLRNSSVYQQGIPELQARPRGGAGAGDDQFLACYKAPGSCGLCLLDYDVTIERGGEEEGEHEEEEDSQDQPQPQADSDSDRSTEEGQQNVWQMTVNAYHQIGACRSPDDWKWARFTERSRPHLFLPNRPNRRGSGYSQGSVKRMWAFGGSLSDQELPGLLEGLPAGILAAAGHRKRHSI